MSVYGHSLTFWLLVGVVVFVAGVCLVGLGYTWHETRMSRRPLLDRWHEEEETRG